MRRVLIYWEGAAQVNAIMAQGKANFLRAHFQAWRYAEWSEEVASLPGLVGFPRWWWRRETLRQSLLAWEGVVQARFWDADAVRDDARTRARDEVAARWRRSAQMERCFNAWRGHGRVARVATRWCASVRMEQCFYAWRVGRHAQCFRAWRNAVRLGVELMGRVHGPRPAPSACQLADYTRRGPVVAASAVLPLLRMRMGRSAFADAFTGAGAPGQLGQQANAAGGGHMYFVWAHFEMWRQYAQKSMESAEPEGETANVEGGDRHTTMGVRQRGAGGVGIGKPLASDWNAGGFV